MRDKTGDDRFFILTLLEIAMELECDGLQAQNDIVKVNLPVGLPPAHYGAIYKRFERYFRREGNIQFTYRRNPYTIAIGDVLSYPQDSAAAMTIYPEIKCHTKARIIDIGGFSLDYLELKNGVPNMEAGDPLENGVITLLLHPFSASSRLKEPSMDTPDITTGLNPELILNLICFFWRMKLMILFWDVKLILRNGFRSCKIRHFWLC